MRQANPYASAYPVDPTFAIIGDGLGRALFGDPVARQAQQQAEAEMAATRALMAQRRAAAGLDTARTEGVDIQNRASLNLVDVLTKGFAPPPPVQDMSTGGTLADIVSGLLAAARDLSRKGHDIVVAPYAAFAKIKKQIASLNRAIAAAEKASEDTGTMQAQLAALDEDLREAFADLYDVVEAAWSTQAAADWLLKIQSSNPHDVDSRGPDGNFLKGRELPPEADKLLEKYMVRDPVNVMMLYSGKVARRIEYAERFGADNKKIDALFVQMGREGVSAVGQDQVRAIFDVVTGRSVSTLPPGVNWAFEAIHVI